MNSFRNDFRAIIDTAEIQYFGNKRKGFLLSIRALREKDDCRKSRNSASLKMSSDKTFPSLVFIQAVTIFNRKKNKPKKVVKYSEMTN
jgi:hypothetical protein